MKDTWRRITTSGIHESQDTVLKRNIVLTNSLALILLMLSLVLAMLILIYFGPVISCAMAASSVLLYSGVIMLNRAGHINAGRMLLAIGVPVWTLSTALVSKSFDLFIEEFEFFDTRLIILSSTVLPMVIFDIRERKRLWAGLFACFAILVLYDPIHNMFGVGYFQAGLSSLNYPFINIIGVLCWALITGSMYTLKYQILKHEQALEHNNHTLLAKNNELSSLYNEIEAQNEEILAQTEEIVEKRDQMQQAHTIIMMQKEQLQKENKNLQEELVENNVQLKQTNKELLRHVQELEQFSYTISHNLRGPVARLLGLTHLFEKEKVDNGNKEIILHIEDSAKKLDQTLKDLTKILELRRDLLEKREKVDLHDEMDRVKHMLAEKIEATNTEIREEIEIEKFYSIRGFIQSILFNLISNAIRYRSTERKPLITVSATTQEEHLVLMVSDNGLGIDMEKYGAKLFDMYKTFHEHAKGRGLGLYLVRMQIDLLGGNLKVESEPGVGTSFIINLPLKAF
ncbi:ATP-binding protein [Roseivirga sp. BDSF3-8]|uniref:sensor histidine kinase n=1 Tax=Roseivirga sp. BDSF3-8 TaxID=3241598 RepID=UPI003531BFBD